MSENNGVAPISDDIKRKNRQVISGLVVLFVVPVILAYTAFYMGWFNQPTKNKGVLLESPYPRFEQFAWFDEAGEALHFKDFETQWWWLYFPESNQCNAECELNMSFMARVHQGLGKRVEKLTRMAIFPDEIQYADRVEKKLQLRLAKGNGKPHIGDGVQLEVGKIYAMDVHGNIFMQYEPVKNEQEARMKAKDLRDDIVRAMRNTGL